MLVLKNFLCLDNLQLISKIALQDDICEVRQGGFYNACGCSIRSREHCEGLCEL